MRRREVRTSESIFLDIRGLRYHCRCWGDPQAPKLFLLHGWMDVSASFQFLVDAFRGEWRAIAPDWRGYGLTAWSGADSYWFPDYLADLDALLGHFSADAPAHLIGHSMGGNVACLYAGVRPERVAKLVNLEGFGLRGNEPTQAPSRYAAWLASLAEPQQFRNYSSFDELATRLQQANPRLTPERARFLAEHWGAATPENRVALRSDPAHKRVNPVLYRVEEARSLLAGGHSTGALGRGGGIGVAAAPARRHRVVRGTQALLRDARRADDCGRRTHAPSRSTGGGSRAITEEFLLSRP